MSSEKTPPRSGRLDHVVAEAQRNRLQREQDYREQALKLFPWVCARCGREFTRENLAQLTVHHKDHNHDNNPADGSNWELLCVYCHDAEHGRYLGEAGNATVHEHEPPSATYKPFADLDALLSKKD
ncbi:MAG: YajD family HNH nuclease [Gammaproteobacteria bacterium]|jgi:5-methylcytosine-specific restriction endonuclease McrA